MLPILVIFIEHCCSSTSMVGLGMVFLLVIYSCLILQMLWALRAPTFQVDICGLIATGEVVSMVLMDKVWSLLLPCQVMHPTSPGLPSLLCMATASQSMMTTTLILMIKLLSIAVFNACKTPVVLSHVVLLLV